MNDILNDLETLKQIHLLLRKMINEKQETFNAFESNLEQRNEFIEKIYKGER